MTRKKLSAHRSSVPDSQGSKRRFKPPHMCKESSMTKYPKSVLIFKEIEKFLGVKEIKYCTFFFSECLYNVINLCKISIL